MSTPARGENREMKVFGVTGASGMGKTTLLARLVPALVARGQVVSMVKHSHKDIEIDRPGKDSFRLREAGCHEVMLLGASRWALMHELRGAAEPGLDELLARLAPCDLVLLEGFKQGDFPKLEVWRPELGRPSLWPAWPGIVGIATNATRSPRPLDADKGMDKDADADASARRPPILDLDAIDAIADFVLAHAEAR
jgi:molybdopterin-guanine dinucleotide biosynthesis protein B